MDKSRIKESIVRIWTLVKKEFRLLSKDKYAIVMALILPILITLSFSFLMDTSGDPTVNTAVVFYDSNSYFINDTYSVVDSNHTPSFINAMKNVTNINILREFNCSENIYGKHLAQQMLINKEIQAIIIIPVEFSEVIDLNLSLPLRVDCIPDGSNMLLVQSYIRAFTNAVKIFITEENLSSQISIAISEDFLPPSIFNADFTFTASLAFPFMLLGFTMILTILVIVSEDPIPRLLITPAKRSEILISKYITYTVVGLFQSASMLITGMIMGLYAPLPIDLFLIIFITAFYGITLGMLISTLSSSKTQANQLFFFVFLIMLLLSGMFIPLDSLPIFLQYFAYCLPMAHASPLFENAIYKGIGILQNPVPFFALLGISSAFIVITFILFYRKQMEV
ncbi:MAG: ABC transporter permease [Candidatus Helarchaeota archaeon]